MLYRQHKIKHSLLQGAYKLSFNKRTTEGGEMGEGKGKTRQANHFGVSIMPPTECQSCLRKRCILRRDWKEEKERVLHTCWWKQFQAYDVGLINKTTYLFTIFFVAFFQPSYIHTQDMWKIFVLLVYYIKLWATFRQINVRGCAINKNKYNDISVSLSYL